MCGTRTALVCVGRPFSRRFEKNDFGLMSKDNGTCVFIITAQQTALPWF